MPQDNSAVLQEDEYTPAYFKPGEVLVQARDNMSFLGGLCLPEICTVPFPAWYLYIWGIVVQAIIAAGKNFGKFAIALPRGHAKTTVIKLLIVWIILFSNKRFILVVGASLDLAQNVIKDVADILDSPNILTVFGNWRVSMEKDTEELKIFNFRGRAVILKAIGTGVKLRGINVKNARPDVIICDDMQTKEDSESEIVSKKLITWFVGTLMKAKSPRGCVYLYVGNMYRDIQMGGSTGKLYTCILRNLQLNPSWVSLIVGGILADGTALWEEVQPLEQLLSEYNMDASMGQADVFFAEVLNDPKCGSGQFFDLSKLPPFGIDPAVDLKLGSFVMIDPSLGKKRSDAQIVAEFEVYDAPMGDLHYPVDIIKNVHFKQVSAPDLVEFVIELCTKNKIPLVCAESVAYQGTLLQWFEKIVQIKRANGEFVPDIKFLPIAPGGRTKNSRIINWFKRLMSGRSKVHPESLSLVLSQIQTFDPMTQNNVDDVIDTGAYGEDVVLNYPTELMSTEIYSLDQTEYSVVENNWAF